MPTVKPVPDKCPQCGNGVWDNRATKKNPKAPDFKCRDKSCDWVAWPPSARDKFAWADAPHTAPETHEPPPEFGKSGHALLDAPEPDVGLAIKRIAMSGAFVDATTFVMESIVPMFEKSGVGLTDETIYKYAFSLWQGWVTKGLV